VSERFLPRINTKVDTDALAVIFLGRHVDRLGSRADYDAMREDLTARLDEWFEMAEAALPADRDEGLPDADVLGMALDLVDEEDARVGVVGRGRKVDRVVAEYARISTSWTRRRTP
jgi:hypothetical protein